MAWYDDTFTGTYAAGDLQRVIPTVWSHFINKWYEAKLHALKFFTDLSEDISEGGDFVEIPDIYTNDFTVRDKVTDGVGPMTVEGIAFDHDTLTINKWKYIAFLIEDKQAAAVLRRYNVQKLLAKKAAYGVAKQNDTDILSLYSSLTNTVNDSAGNLTDPDIREAIATLEDADVPMDELGFFIHPKVHWEDLMGITKYYDASILGVERGPVITGKLPFIYDIPVYKTTQVVKTLSCYYNLLAHKESLGFAFQPMFRGRNDLKPKVRLEVDRIPENKGVLWANDNIYGVGVLRDAAAVVLKAETSGSIAS